MQNPTTRIVLCSKCSDIHLSIGSMTLNLDREAFDRLARTITQAAAQLDLQTDPGPVAEQGVGSHWLSRKMSAC